MKDLISKQAAIDALWKALYAYEDKTEKQFQESDELDIGDWILHRIFVQNMSDIDRQTILNLPTIEVEPIKHAHWIHEHLASTNGGSYAVVRCSNCLSQYPMTEENYCPNCGAKMDEVEE